MSFRPPSFSAIAAFEAAARHENFARAAAELNLTQSAISHAVRALEARIGERLFHRHGRRVTLSPHGAQLAQRIRASLALLAAAFGENIDETDSRRVVIGAPPEYTARVLLPCLADGDLLDSCEVRANLPIGALSEGSADVIITRGSGSWPALASRPLGKDSLFPVAAPAIARLRGFPNLSDLPIIENVAHPWRFWLAQLQRADDLPGLGLVVDDWGLALDAAKAGAGVCLARGSLVREELASGRLIRVGRAELPLEDGYHLVWNPQAVRRPPAQAVVEWLTAELAAPHNEFERSRADSAQKERRRIKLVDSARLAAAGSAG